MKNNKSFIAVRAIAYCAMLAALSIVFARLLSISPPGGVRWSLDKFPLFLAGMLFGPVMGALTGFACLVLHSPELGMFFGVFFSPFVNGPKRSKNNLMPCENYVMFEF